MPIVAHRMKAKRNANAASADAHLNGCFSTCGAMRGSAVGPRKVSELQKLENCLSNFKLKMQYNESEIEKEMDKAEEKACMPKGLSMFSSTSL